MRKLLGRSALAVLLLPLLAVGLSAQTDRQPVPDAYVRGFGAIAFSADPTSTAKPTMGVFSISVNRFGNDLLGWISYYEILPTGKPGARIVANELKKLDIQGNMATIDALGRFNNQIAHIRVEVLDDNPSGDWLRITAHGGMLPVQYYDAAGGVVQGDIIVWTRPDPVPFTRGSGAIQVMNQNMPTNLVGNFQFNVVQWPAGAEGFLAYHQFNPSRIWDANAVRITMPEAVKLEVQGSVAVFHGKGDLNGKPVRIVARVADNVRPPVMPSPAAADYMMIEAWAPVAAATGPVFRAEGPVIRGDLLVGFFYPMF